MKLDVARATALNAHLQLRTIGLASLRADFVDPLEGAVEALGWQLRPVEIQWLPVGSELKALCPFEIDIHVQVAGAQVHAVAIRVALTLTYALQEGREMPPDEDLSHCIGVLGFMHAWPYLRADVQSLSSRLGLPVLVLPVILSGQVPELATAQRGTLPLHDAEVPPQASKKTAAGRKKTTKKTR